MRRRVRVRLLVVVLLVAGAVALVWAASDGDYEAAAGIDKALQASPPTLTADSDVEGHTFDADGAFGQAGCKATFAFAIGKTVTSPYPAAGRPVKGVYVRINTTFDKTKCEARCEEVRTLQVFRKYTKNAAGGKDAVDPVAPQRRERAGWSEASSASRGWMVDSGDSGPFYGPGGAAGSAESGSTDNASIERDAPGDWDGMTAIGKDLLACGVCVNSGHSSKIMACVNWGYYIDGAGNVAFDPKSPVGSGSPPQQVKDALDRFEKIPGNGSANVQF